MFRKLPMYDHHFVDENGNVLNDKTGTILKPYVGNGGYLYVKPCEYNKTKHLSIHRAVAICFCDGYKKGYVVDHIDAVKYAVENYNVKGSMLSKHNKYKNVRVEKCND